jgi:hypothetical protein
MEQRLQVCCLSIPDPVDVDIRLFILFIQTLIRKNSFVQWSGWGASSSLLHNASCSFFGDQMAV